MKTCPFCAEDDLQDAAIKCKHCCSSLNTMFDKPAIRNPKMRGCMPVLVILFFTALTLLSAVHVIAAPTATVTDKASIVAVMHQNAPTTSIDHVTVVEDWAMVEWTRAGDGGQALFHKKTGSWLCVSSGGGFFTDINRYGVPKSLQAQLLHIPAGYQAQQKQATPQDAANQTVWVNTKTGIYHYPGTRWYGHTKQGEFMPESQARADGYRAAENGQ